MPPPELELEDEPPEDELPPEDEPPELELDEEPGITSHLQELLHRFPTPQGVAS